MIVQPFKVADYYKAELVNAVGLEHWGLFHSIDSVLLFMEISKTFWTVWDGEQVVAIGGWLQAWKGVCEVSLYPTKLFLEKPFSVLRRIKQQIDFLKKHNRRIQLNCRKEALFMNFATRLGFHYEGTLKNFSYDGTDHIIMAIIGGSNE